MVTIGAQYLVGQMLVHRKKSHKDYVTFSEVIRVGWEIQKACNEAGIDVLVERGGYDIKALVYDYPEYFTYGKDYVGNGEPLIVSERSIEALEARFCGYLPLDVILVMVKEIEKNL